jgi:hypothetical protein
VARQAWTRWLPWLALALFVLAVLLNGAGYPFAWWFVLPVGLGVVGLVFAVKARRRVDVVVSVLVVLALPVWVLILIVGIQFVRLPNNAFSP